MVKCDVIYKDTHINGIVFIGAGILTGKFFVDGTIFICRYNSSARISENMV